MNHLGSLGHSIVIDGIQAFKEYEIAFEQEKTERERIRSAVKCFCENVKNQRKIIITELTNKHKERMALIDCYSLALEVSVQNKDQEISKCILHNMDLLISLDATSQRLDQMPKIKELLIK